MTALTESWRNIKHITVERLYADGSRGEHTGFPVTISRCFDGVVMITFAVYGGEVVAVKYRLIGDGETLEPVR
jgi:hypothetical protein